MRSEKIWKVKNLSAAVLSAMNNIESDVADTHEHRLEAAAFEIRRQAIHEHATKRGYDSCWTVSIIVRHFIKFCINAA